MKKYPAHSTEPYKTPPPVQIRKIPTPPSTPPVWVRYLFVVCLFVLIGSMWVGGMWLDENREQPAAIAAIHTNTPEPSATPQPTRTPYPTFTHMALSTIVENISDSVQNTPITQYILHTVEVTRLVEVERIITTTPQPTQRATRTLVPTADATQTQAAFVTGIDNRKAVQMTWLSGLGIAGLYFVGLILIIVAIIATWKEATKRPTMEDTTEKAEDILTVNDARRDRRIIQLHRARWSMNKIQIDVFGYTGGTAYDTVSRVIREYNTSGRIPTPPPGQDDINESDTQA